MTVPTLGICYVPTLPPERLQPLARAADVHLDELWVWEDCFKQGGIAGSAVALGCTERLRVGLGLMPAPLRNVALTAMEIAMLQRTFPGRFIPGVGHGVQDWMGQSGVRAASPMTLLTEYLAALQALLAGESVTVRGDYVQLDDVQLRWPLERPEPLMSGGEGPRSIALAARETGSLLLSAGLTTARVAAAREIAVRARSDAGAASPETLDVVATLMVSTGPGSAERLRDELGRWGIDPDCGVGVAGDAEAVAAQIRSFGALGVTSVVAQPTEDEPDLDGLVAFIGEEVRPLVG